MRNHSPTTSKLDPRSFKCVFVGYSNTQKGYKCYHPPTRRFLISMDVTFQEDEIYFVPILSPILRENLVNEGPEEMTELIEMPHHSYHPIHYLETMKTSSGDAIEASGEKVAMEDEETSYQSLTRLDKGELLTRSRGKLAIQPSQKEFLDSIDTGKYSTDPKSLSFDLNPLFLVWIFL